MKRIFLILMIFSGLALSAQNPLGYSDGNFPLVNYRLKKTENTWLKNKDSIYSAFKINDGYYASMVKWSQSSEGFAMAAKNDESVPVKNGFDIEEQVYWGVCRNGVIYELELDTTYTKDFDIYAKFNPTTRTLNVADNPYYSLSPLWPDNPKYKIKKPTATNRTYFLYNLSTGGGEDWKLKYPKYITGIKWEMVDGTTIITNDKKGFLNQAKFRFTAADIERGFILVKMIGKPLKNSTSTDISRVYKIYW